MGGGGVGKPNEGQQVMSRKSPGSTARYMGCWVKLWVGWCRLWCECACPCAWVWVQLNSHMGAAATVDGLAGDKGGVDTGSIYVVKLSYHFHCSRNFFGAFGARVRHNQSMALSIEAFFPRGLYRSPPPPRFAGRTLTAFAVAYRCAVAEYLPLNAGNRAFWESFWTLIWKFVQIFVHLSLENFWKLFGNFGELSKFF